MGLRPARRVTGFLEQGEGHLQVFQGRGGESPGLTGSPTGLAPPGCQVPLGDLGTVWRALARAAGQQVRPV
ncbi:hypothetical protein [Streptomyces sp. NPDC088760]|uniref:hypothetical protein n=1 Tax=Streptomyces sp. NPDC088760 TaxID=3365890 RepID=UPI003813EED6